MIDRYFDVARFWGDIAHVMDLTVPELLLYSAQANRISELEKG